MTKIVDPFEVVHEAFDADEQKTRDPVGESPSLARKAVDAVLDVHHEFKGHCFECSKGVSTSSWPRMATQFPCRTVQAILEVVRAGA